MRTPRRILLYVVVAVQLLSFLSIGWDGLRHVALPDGATPTQALIIFVLMVMWEDLIRIKIHLDVD
jgi:hypothetical protein